MGSGVWVVGVGWGGWLVWEVGWFGVRVARAVSVWGAVGGKAT